VVEEKISITDFSNSCTAELLAGISSLAVRRTGDVTATTYGTIIDLEVCWCCISWQHSTSFEDSPYQDYTRRAECSEQIGQQEFRMLASGPIITPTEGNRNKAHPHIYSNNGRRISRNQDVRWSYVEGGPNYNKK
jgi:hypothetical protein